MLSECFKMVPLVFVFSICYLAFMCNAVCDMETSIISFLTCFDLNSMKIIQSSLEALRH